MDIIRYLGKAFLRNVIEMKISVINPFSWIREEYTKGK